MFVSCVILCLDVVEGCVVKGVNFENLCDMGDFVELVRYYVVQGVDEIIFFDVIVMVDVRVMMYDVVQCIVEQVFVLLIVGGGVCSVDDVVCLFFVGVDKVGVNFVVIVCFELIGEIVDCFGVQVFVLLFDVKCVLIMYFGFVVMMYGGWIQIMLDVLDWVCEVVECGVGEFFVNLIDVDGMCDGFDFEFVCFMCEVVFVFVIVLGGVGCVVDFVFVIKVGVDVVFVVSVFYMGVFMVGDVKDVFCVEGVVV